MTLIATAKQRRDEAESRYSDLLDRLLRNEDVDETEALSIIDKVGKSPEAVEKEVTRRKRILELEVILSHEAELKAEQQALTEAFGIRRKELEDQLNTLNRQLTTEGVLFNTKSNGINVKLNAIRQARLELNELTKTHEPTVKTETQEFTEAFTKHATYSPVNQ